MKKYWHPAFFCSYSRSSVYHKNFQYFTTILWCFSEDFCGVCDMGPYTAPIIAATLLSGTISVPQTNDCDTIAGFALSPTKI